MQRNNRVILIFVSGILLGSCLLSNINQKTNHSVNVCDNQITEQISIEKLVGKWISTTNSESYYEEIEILDETYYRQSVILGTYEYNSPKLTWKIEKSQSNGMYFHFDKLRYCRMTDEMCQFEEGGGRDWLFFDSCDQSVAKMKNEGKLLLVSIEGTQLSKLYSSQNDLVLKMMKPDPDFQSIYYIKVEDDGAKP